MYATHHDDVGLGLGCRLCQGERVAHEVGYILQVGFGVIVSQDYCILLLSHATNLMLQLFFLHFVSVLSVDVFHCKILW